MSALDRLAESAVVAVIRAPSVEVLPEMVRALVSGGIDLIEVTTSTPNAIDGLHRLNEEFGEQILLGLGTVLEADLVLEAVRAGARFVVSPVFLPEVVRATKDAGALAMPGCFSPTEVFTAWQAGADVVKVFPATSLGPSYLRDLRGPMPFLRLMPTGGVEASNVGDWLAAGAVAVGAGSNLTPKADVVAGNWAALEQRGTAYREAVLAFRQAQRA